MPPDDGQHRRELLMIRLGAGRYGWPVGRIEEVIPWRSATPVPGAAPEVTGVLSHRGRMVCVLDGRRLVGERSASPGEEARILILDDEGEALGILVDGVGEVDSADTAELEPLPDGRESGAPALVVGLWHRSGGPVAVLDEDRVLEWEGDS